MPRLTRQARDYREEACVLRSIDGSSSLVSDFKYVSRSYMRTSCQTVRIAPAACQDVTCQRRNDRHRECDIMSGRGRSVYWSGGEMPNYARALPLSHKIVVEFRRTTTCLSCRAYRLAACHCRFCRLADCRKAIFDACRDRKRQGHFVTATRQLSLREGRATRMRTQHVSKNLSQSSWSVITQLDDWRSNLYHANKHTRNSLHDSSVQSVRFRTQLSDRTLVTHARLT